jgi:hypothetical protein
MRDLSTLEYHPTAEKIVETLCKKTQNPNRRFYRVVLSYYLAKMAATMRVNVETRHRGVIPVNLYCINLAPSGQCKGFSTNLIEDHLIQNFETVFMEQTLPVISDENLAKLAVKRAYLKNEDPDTMENAVRSEYRELGKLKFNFDSATPPAVKQMRHKLIMAGIGAVNLEIDEIGINLLPNSDVFGTFLELFDIGKIKDKLTKNTKENIRHEEVKGITPTNLNAFGTPTKLLDGGKTEDTFYSFLDMGYARRCLFGYTRASKKTTGLTAKEVYDVLTDPTLSDFLKETSAKFGKLADAANYKKHITMSEKVSLHQIDYQLHCERLAEKMGEHQEMAKAEMAHRFFKAIKLAGTYAFIDGHSTITEDNWYAAVCMVEESGEAFSELLARDRSYVKLAKYLASTNTEVTQVDLTEDLPFYKGSAAARNELMQYAVAWGHKHHVVIKKTMTNGIEFIKGESLKRTDLKKLTVAYSHDISDGYKSTHAPWNRLHELVLQKGLHWINHHSVNGHRDDEHMIPGFNMVVLDVDKGVKVKDVVTLMKDYKFLLYTTKRHSPSAHRFRLILPMNYHISMGPDEYRDFMNNVYDWLPFDVDTQTSQRSRKWLTHPGQHYYNDGDQLLDARLFIPKTAKNDEQKQAVQSLQSLSNLERWFIVNSKPNENRNVQLHKYAMVLVDMGYDATSVRTQVLNLNSNLDDSITEKEIDQTIMTTVHKEIGKRAAKAA